MSAEGRVWGVTMMRDEEDVAYHVIRHLAGEGVDGIIVADNLSTDGTRSELERVKEDLAASSDWHEQRCDVVIVDDPEVGYYQSKKMTALATMAGGFGAEWIVPFDADELWYSDGDRLGEVLRAMPDDVGLVEAPLWNHYATSIDRIDPVPFRSLVYKHRPRLPLPKAAVRWKPTVQIQQGNHSSTGYAGAGIAMDDSPLAVRHFPYRSWEHFLHKVIVGSAAYAATDLPVTMGDAWRQYGEILKRHGEEGLRQVYDEWFYFVSPTDADLALDPAPFRRWS